MQKIPRSQMQLADDLLRALLRSIGYEALRARLETLKHEKIDESAGEGKDKEKKNKRRSAKGFVEKLDNLDNDKRTLLTELASRFDQKLFLPSIGDVRHFFERKHINAETIRARDAVIPRLIELLAELPSEAIKGILADENYSGPSRLGPLADAIKARGSEMRSNTADPENRFSETADRDHT